MIFINVKTLFRSKVQSLEIFVDRQELYPFHRTRSDYFLAKKLKLNIFGSHHLFRMKLKKEQRNIKKKGTVRTNDYIDYK